MPPKIGITMAQEETGACLRRPYYECVGAAGALPWPLPPLPGALAGPLLDELDGLLLAGGGDLDPAYFGEPPLPPGGESEPLRDVWELALIREAWRRKLPILAICRGMQVLNAALGGTLWQDARYLPGPRLEHQQSAPPEQTSHRLRSLEPRLAQIVGARDLAVNSHHHQMVRRVAPPLQAAAWTADGVIEALLPRADGRFCLAVQWHPERLADAASARIFAALTLAAQEFALQKPKTP